MMPPRRVRGRRTPASTGLSAQNSVAGPVRRPRCPDGHPELGAYYNRVLNYHAAHDVSYLLIDNPLVSRAGCTSFGVWGHATPDQHLITGRNFDWEAAEVFSRDRVAILYEPDQGIPFVSLAWAGMAGVVSGQNRAGISVTINGAPSHLPGGTATPVAVVARQVLQTARNLDEALKIIREARVFVSTLWLLGSRADGRFLVVERTPAATFVREPEGGDAIICANHFETEALRKEQRNREYEADSTSLSRQRRLAELIRSASATGGIDPSRAAELLRDRRLPGGVSAGNGHRGTLNPFIATHATVMDLTEGIFWASVPPHQLGKFVGIDVKDFERELSGRTLPADSVLASGEFDRARQAQRALAEGRVQLRGRRLEKALQLAEQAESLNPGFYQNSFLRGRTLLALGRRAEAVKVLEAGLQAAPAFRVEREEMEALLQQARRSR